MGKTYKPGEKAPDSGQYEIVGPRGGHTGIERTVTKGETFSIAAEIRLAIRSDGQNEAWR